MGIDWWEHDPTLSSGQRGLAEENRLLRQRVEALETGRPVEQEGNGAPVAQRSPERRSDGDG
jgi:hypothetical protein